MRGLLPSGGEAPFGSGAPGEEQDILSTAQAAFRGSSSGPSACPAGSTVVGYLV